MRIAIIGAGPGGYQTALSAASKGFETLLFEAGNIGGTCLNAGCIPTKTFCRAAELIHESTLAADYGICTEAGNLADNVKESGTESGNSKEKGTGSGILDFPKLTDKKNRIVGELRSSVETMLDAANIQVIRGFASLKDSRTVSCNGEDYPADYIIVATGSAPAFLPVEGVHCEGVLTSEQILDLEVLPDSLCIIGAGVIGMEFASVFSAFGTKVTVIEYCKEVLPRMDSDLAKRLRQSLSKRGVEFFTRSSVTAIEKQDDGMKVCWSRKEKPESAIFGKVLMAVGRRPVVDNLGLEAAGVEYSAKGIVTDEFMRTSVPNIFAIGDVNGRQMLAHAATFQGIVALDAICRQSCSIDLSIMPAAVFTHPEMASVGLSEDECETRNIEYKTSKSFFRANGKAVTMSETEGICKIVTAPDGLLLGCHILGPHAADIVQEVSCMMARKATLADLRSCVHIHPTLSEVLM